MNNSDDDEFLTGDRADQILSHLGQTRIAAATASSKDSPWLNAIAVLEESVREGTLPPKYIEKLVDVIPSEYFESVSVDADFDMGAELGAQRNLVNALRNKVMSAGGRGLHQGVSISEAKSVMDSCRQFGEVIRKNMESVNNLSRVQALEAAILVTVNDYPEEFRRDFLANLEKQLLIHCKTDK